MSILGKEDINIFAKTNFRGQERPFGIKLDDRRRHVYVIGKTGMGKSVLLRNFIAQDIQSGKGVAFIDPHGDTAEEVLNFVPKNRINDVVYFNPADISNPIAFNILEAVDEDHKHLIAAGMMGVFKKIWPDVWSPRMEYILNNTILALLDYPGSTMLGINRMMSDKKFRSQVMESIKDPIVKSFWVDEFEKWDPRFAREASAAIQNKVGQFISTPIVRHIVGQTKSTINMRQIMDEGKILIVNLSKGRIGEEVMLLLGGMIVTRLYLAAMERVDVAESERKDFFLYVDEFHNFATNESFASILSEARKYRLAITIAHQYMAQLTEEVRDAIFGNVGTSIAFRLGATDAEFLEKEFAPAVTMNDLVDLPKYQIYLKLMIDGLTGDAFSAATLPPLPYPETVYADKVIETSRERYGRPREGIEKKISIWMDKTFETQRDKAKKNYDSKNVKKEEKKDGQKYMSPARIVNKNTPEKVEEKIKEKIAVSAKKEEVKKEIPQEQKPPTVWKEAICDRCGVQTKVPFEPEKGRDIFCKECLREVRRQKALSSEGKKEVDKKEEKKEVKKTSRVSDEKKEKLKKDLRKILEELRTIEEK